MNELLISLFLSTLRVSTPLIFAAMGGVMSERAGVVNIALEGFMIVGAFSASAVAHSFHSPWMGAGAAFLVGAAFAAVYALAVIQFKADQIVAGTAINLLALGTVPLVSKALFDSTGSTPALDVADRFQSAPLYVSFILVTLIHLWMRTTRTGLWHGFAGENPEALSTAGIRVRAVRWWSVIVAGGLAGLGGMTLSIFLSSSYSRGMTAGRGFMALAALIFGKWKPIPTLIACLFFGLTDALQIRLQGASFFGSDPIPVQFIQILPYVITVFVLAGFVGKSRAPAKLGVPWMLIAAIGLGGLGSGCDRVQSMLGSREAALQAPAVSDAALVEGNVALLGEMMQVVLGAERVPAEVMNPRVSAIRQGASLEGIYNGLVNSAEYRGAEQTGIASPGALKAFAGALAELQMLAPKPWRMPRQAVAPPQRISRPEGEETGTSVSSISMGWKEHEEALTKKDREALAEFYRSSFAKSSFYTLKRVLGEAVILALDTADAKAADFYADLTLAWNARASALGADLGVAPRVSKDRTFHLKWAQSIPQDRVIWEALNRSHRILNSAQRAG